MLLVLFNEIRVHSLVPLIVDNDPINNRCVGITPLMSGSGSGFTADDKKLGLHSRQQFGVRVRISSSCQGAGKGYG